jgi:hypothetical protein
MRSFVTVVICGCALAATAAAGVPRQLSALRIATKTSGLRATSRPKVVVLAKSAMQQEAVQLLDRTYPPEQQAYDEILYRAFGLLPEDLALRPLLLQRAGSVAGAYDPVSRIAYVRAGATRRTLVRELVHALQDQRFKLHKRTGVRSGQRDAALATTAAVDGHAIFAANVLPGLGRRLAASSGPAIGDFLALEAGFAGATGVRFVSTLQNLGGRGAIFTALSRFPATTEQIFPIDAFLQREPAVPIALPTAVAKFGLVRQDTFGELDVRALLAAFGVPRVDRVGGGWGGGRTGLYRDASGRQSVVLALDWDDDVDADQWAEAVATYVNEAFDADRPGFPATTPCEATACWSLGGREIAFVRSGRRTALVFGPTISSAATIAQQVVS